MANQGGTHDQHVKSGQQSHKGGPADKTQGGSGAQQAGGRGGQEQQGKGGQQGNKSH